MKISIQAKKLHFLNITPGRWRPSFCTHCLSLIRKFSLTRRSTTGVTAQTSLIRTCKSCIVAGRVSKTFDLRYPHKKKSQELRSGDRGGH
jgi:hypothetical protein